MANFTEVSSSTVPSATNSSTIIPTDPMTDDKQDHLMSFIIMPVCALGVVCLMSVMVFLFLRKKRLDRLRHHLMPFYNFAPGEEGEDWEAELLEDNADFNRPNLKGYKTMEHEFSTRRNLLSTD